MRRPAIAALAVVAYLVFLVASTPASFMARHVSAAAGGRVQFTQSTGTLWRGAARGRMLAPGGPVFLDSLEWRLLPARLAAGRIAFDVTAASRGFDARFQMARGVTDWEFRYVAARMEAAFLAAFIPFATQWRPEGSLVLAASTLLWDEREMKGDASLEWRNAALGLSDVRPLGSYRLDARARGGPAALELTTIEGALKLAARGTFTPPGGVALSGEARAEGDSAQALAPLLDLIGPPRADGARALELRVN